MSPAAVHDPLRNADPTGLRNVVKRTLERTPLVVRRSPIMATRATYRTPAPILANRSELPVAFNQRRLLGCGVEIGVKRGEFSQFMLENWRGRHLISIDPWLAAPPDEYDDRANVGQDEHDRYYAETLARLERFGDRSTVWRMFGREGAERIPHHALDFVYLDARHDYASVLEDLDDWADKVRPGGILCGHDYIDGQFVDGDFGVKSAVDEFFAARGVKVRATGFDLPWRSWYVVVR